ncbi:hypothetical protein DFH11DRAFT_1878998 [Phellopilus nigrolimitatus]|nr:hypothetical protein DFH11DRAFT_1878998 [Phellopilus nigrolimitatus]
MWMLGYHFKWRTIKKLARANNIRVERPEFLMTAVQNVVRRKSRVNFWISYDWEHRPIITFHEHEDQRDPTGIEFTAWHVLRVARALQMDRPPRWYTDKEGVADQEAESSEDDELDLGPSKQDAEVESDSDDDSEDGDGEDDEVEDGDIEDGNVEDGNVEDGNVEDGDEVNEEPEDGGPNEDSVETSYEVTEMKTVSVEGH